MDDAVFTRLVAEMREAQRHYFRVRSPAVLERSKALEERVDDELRDRTRQPGLFDREDTVHA